MAHSSRSVQYIRITNELSMSSRKDRKQNSSQFCRTSYCYSLTSLNIKVKTGLCETEALFMHKNVSTFIRLFLTQRY